MDSMYAILQLDTLVILQGTLLSPFIIYNVYPMYMYVHFVISTSLNLIQIWYVNQIPGLEFPEIPSQNHIYQSLHGDYWIMHCGILSITFVPFLTISFLNKQAAMVLWWSCHHVFTGSLCEDVSLDEVCELIQHIRGSRCRRKWFIWVLSISGKTNMNPKYEISSTPQVTNWSTWQLYLY